MSEEARASEFCEFVVSRTITDLKLTPIFSFFSPIRLRHYYLRQIRAVSSSFSPTQYSNHFYLVLCHSTALNISR